MSQRPNRLSWLDRKIGIDLGTSRTRIWTNFTDDLVDEPTCVAVDTTVNKVVAVGTEAAQMKGRVPKHISVQFPIQQGVVVDAEMTQAFLRVLLQQIIPVRYFFRPVMMISTPATMTLLDKELLTELLYGVGAREVYTIAQSLAAVIGSNVPIADASGSFMLYIGGGVVESSVTSFGSIVTSQHSLYGGLYADQVIRRAINQEYQTKVSLEVARELKQTLGSLLSTAEKQLVTGQNISEKTPVEVAVSAEIIKSALVPVVDRYTDLVQRLLETVPPELTSDVIDKGLLLSGGFAQLHGLDQYLVQKIGVPVSLVENPELVVIHGVSTALENLDLFKESLAYSQSQKL